jgi:hypothetical protein
MHKIEYFSLIGVNEREPDAKMTKKQLLLILTCLIIAGAFIYTTSGWFGPKPLLVAIRFQTPRVMSAGTTTRLIRALAGRRTNPAPPTSNATVFFNLDHAVRITSIKVFPVSELQTNAVRPHPVWHLVQGTNSVAIRGFGYAENPAVLGLRPAVEGIDPDPLAPGVKYRMFLEAGRSRAEFDFTVPPLTK